MYALKGRRVLMYIFLTLIHYLSDTHIHMVHNFGQIQQWKREVGQKVLAVRKASMPRKAPTLTLSIR